VRDVLSPRTPRALSRQATLLLALGAGLLTAGCKRSHGERHGAPIAADAMPAPDATGTPEARRTAGAALYGKYCALCHGKDAKGYVADHAPSLVSDTFLASATNSFLARAIRNGRPGTAMGAYGASRRGPLSEDQIAAIIDYLRGPAPARVITPPTAPVLGDPSRGEPIFRSTCQRCHGTREQHGEAVHLANPELLDSASDGFLRSAIVHGRPGTPMVSFAGALDDGQIDDVVAFVRTWATPAPRVPPPAPEIPANLPVILNPNGRSPTFTLREERYVAAEQVKKALDAKNRIVIVDARTPAEWVQLRIPGAIPGPYHDLARLDKIPKDGTWIVAYCACPHHASGAVVNELRKRGYRQTAVLDEGIMGWKRLGYPVAGESASAVFAAPAHR